MTEEDGKTAVEILAEKGDTSTMDAFIQRGADITKCVHNIFQLMLDNGHFVCALYRLCSDSYKEVKVTADIFVTALKHFMIANEKKKEETIAWVNNWKLILNTKIGYFELCLCTCQ
jgi:hypothetical protein